jgi:hypothetical protein
VTRRPPAQPVVEPQLEQRLAPALERKLARGAAIEVQQIEREKRDGRRSAVRRAASAEARRPDVIVHQLTAIGAVDMRHFDRDRATRAATSRRSTAACRPPRCMTRDFAEVAGKEPVVLVFATPQLCQSRVCGPVVDIAEQVKSDHEGEAEFIHMEIYRDNTIEKGFRPQVKAFGLPAEPWLFAIDRRGKARRAWRARSARRSWRTRSKATRG